MKKSLLTLLGAGLLLTSCQSDEPFAPGEGGEKQVTFTLNVPGELGTRAVAGANQSDKGGATNQGADQIKYTLVLQANNDTQILDNSKATVSGTTATFTPTVVLGREYTITAYASLKDAWNGVNPIAITNSFNDESKDAYFKTLKHNFANGDLQPLTLTRPYGKLRLIAEDYDPAKTKVESVKITYANPQEGTFNATTEAFTIATENVAGTTKPFGYYEAADATGAHTIFAEYLPAPKTGEYPVSFTVEVKYDGSTETYSRTFNDIPVRRNALTTLKGAFFTAGAQITVIVDENFDGGESVKYYSGVTIGGTNYDSLEEAVAAAQSGDVLRLDGDIVLVYNATRANENFLMEIDKNLTIDLNGKNIKATVGDVTVNSGIFRVVKNGELTIEGEGNIDITTGKAINKLTTFISNEGGIVNLKGGNWTLTSLEYPDALIPCFVDNNSTLGAATLNIYDGTYTFHRNLFRNFANNKNEVATINIFGGTFNGKSNDEGAIWNQKPSANVPDGAGVINVTGGVFNNVVIDDEFGKVSNAENQTELDSNVATANATIQLEAGTYTFPSIFAEGVTLVCEEGVVFEGKSGLNINGATVIGATFSNPNGVAGAGTIHGTYKDCTFKGSETLRWCYSEVGKTVIFEDCVFKTNFRGVHFDTMDGDVTFRNCEINGFNAIGGNGKVTFEGCTFGNDESSYNGLNMYSNIDIKDCKFNFVSGKTNFIDFEEAGKTMNITNSTATLDGAVADIKDFIGGTYGGQTTIIIDGVPTVYSAQALANVVAKGYTNINLADGEYNVYGCGGKTLTLNGSENAILKLYNDGEDGCDYAFGGSGTGVGNITFNGLTIDTQANTGNYKGFAYIKGTFNDCNFVGAYSLNNANDFVFNRCTFDFKNGYFWTWGANSVTFDGCTFKGNSKNILAHGYASTVINIKNCTFAATEKGFTGAGDNTAVVEIDPAGTNTYKINFTGTNTKTEFYNGWTRVKDGSTGHVITGLE